MIDELTEAQGSLKQRNRKIFTSLTNRFHFLLCDLALFYNTDTQLNFQYIVTETTKKALQGFCKMCIIFFIN